MMNKTQIRLPESLCREAKRVVAEYETSLAEVARRSLERTLPAYPPVHPGWSMPEPLALGMRCTLQDDEWRLLANEPDYQP